MSATEMTQANAELPSRLEEPFEPASAADDRPKWGFTLGCAIAVAILFLGLGAHRAYAPRPEARPLSPPPESTSAPIDPFADLEPFAPQDVAPVVPLVPQPQPQPLSKPQPLFRVRAGQLAVSGRLPTEVISRILRQNHGRLRACYETGLRANPNLQGRVTTRFVIGRDGAVSVAANAGSDLPDARVVQCVIRTLHPLSFPQPESGIVTVVYPVVFHPR
jgi:outer membrane biosynthesis protein TonB